MEEMPTRGEWLRKNRKPLAVIVIMFILIPTSIVVYNYGSDGDTEYEISYSVTIWIAPEEEEFAVHLEFYGTQQFAQEQVNKLQGIEFDVQSTDDEEHTFALINLPEGFSGFWVRIYFDSQDEPFTILNAGIGFITTTSLLGREISIQIEPFHT
jgi:hypothetical protein